MSFFIATISARYSYYICTFCMTKKFFFNFFSFLKKIWEYELIISLRDCSLLLCVNNERIFIHSYIFCGSFHDWNNVDSDYFVEAESYKAIKLKLSQKLQMFLNKNIRCGKSQNFIFYAAPLGRFAQKQ